MSELRGMPPVEDAVIAWLAERVPDLYGRPVPVADQPVEARPCVRVRQTGALATIDGLLAQPILTVDVFGKTDGQAWRVASICWGLMRELSGRAVAATVDGASFEVTFGEVSHISDLLNLPDPTTSKPRYVQNVVARAKVVAL